MAGSSRTELVGWLNDLLQINYTKVEQCGTGGAYCQVMDSIYGDVTMARVKMNAKQEYEYLQNYKILQSIFKAKKIDKPILVEKLVKCKMQDNLEFLQWIKRFWEANYPGHEYDPVARRKGVAMVPPATLAPLATGRGHATPSPNSASVARGRTPTGGAQKANTQLIEMEEELQAITVERDFYFGKLRDIEVLVQEALDAEDKDRDALKEIQRVLYLTQDGFEVPNDNGAEEEETF